MTRSLQIIAVLALAACGQQAEQEGNANAPAKMVEQAISECSPPELLLADGSKLDSALMDETKANFAAAYGKACTKGVLKAGPLIDPNSAELDRLFLINAPEANVASIYMSEVDGSRMVLEYPFLTTDGKSRVPSADELEEAIYCAVVGATPEEQESSGRCQVD
jgi:hypothetical protein